MPTSEDQICDLTELPKAMCGHCTGADDAYEESVRVERPGLTGGLFG